MNVRRRFQDSARVLAESELRLERPLERAVERLLECLRNGGTVLTCGNGGSAADAQHMAAELVCRVRRDRVALPAIALSTDSSVLTAIGNDLGFERVFARQVEALARESDVLVAVSTSGASENVLQAARAARRQGCGVIALTGQDGGDLAQLADILIDVPSKVTARIQEIHGLCIHVLVELIEDAHLDRGQKELS